MEEESEFRPWDELIPEALSLIFINLSLREILTVIPCVCKPWGRVVSGPYCWQEIDIQNWSSHCLLDDNYITDRMLQLLISRSCGPLRKLCVSGIRKDSSFSLIADRVGSLETLGLPRSAVTDSIVEHIAGRLSNVTFMDLSFCRRIGVGAIEAIGKNCHLLVGFCRNMDPFSMKFGALFSQDQDAHAIADTMPKLKRLELAYNQISTESAGHILSSCAELEHLDLSGCRDVKLDELKKSFPKLTVLGLPFIMHHTRHAWDEDDSPYYIDWEFSSR